MPVSVAQTLCGSSMVRLRSHFTLNILTLSDSDEPVKPNLRIMDINLNGVVYSAKLAMHYFRKQPQDLERDRCFIIKGSLAGFLDQPGSPQYNISKWGGRALMRCLRRTAWQEGIRVNYVAPWYFHNEYSIRNRYPNRYFRYIRTPIMSEQVQQRVESMGVEFALQEDALKTMLRISSDREVNGKIKSQHQIVLPDSNEFYFVNFSPF
jgi:NAD(P)-dependent dehydrogenase (short-subunit alcohol dehydrogenase family)